MSEPAIGDNSVAADQVRAFIERVERLEDEKRGLAEDVKSVFAEAKGRGLDVKILRKIVAIRRMDRDKWREENEILDVYLTALGMG